MAKKSKKPSSYHHGDLKQTLIGHALSIIDNEGIGGLTLRKAARHAGVSHAAPAHHFGDMKGLMVAIAIKGFSKMILQMEKALSQTKDDNSLLKLKLIGLAYIEFAVQHRSFFKVMYHSELSKKGPYPDLEKESRIPFKLLKSTVQDCQDNQLIKKGDIENIALFAWSTVHGIANLLVDSQLKSKGLLGDDMQYADHVTNLLYTGLKYQ
ncbi:MAG: TetR/AcrR family transcriptional regulator [Deltaproteobacteria bacterium]|nr:TetR/AcrR family transcriptional regulator [Deltaproteobacteria bacterium]